MSDLRIGLGFSFFDSAKEIPRALDPLYKHFYKLYCVDGRYINYETDHDLSIDGSCELLEKRYPNAVVEKAKPLFQPYKRQKYLDMAGEDNCDYLIVWDSDDILYPDPKYQNWNKLFKNIEKHAARFPDYRIFKMKAWIPSDKEWRKAYNSVRSNVWNPYIRIHKDPGTMRYCLDCHFWWAPKDTTDEDLILQKRGMFVADHTIEGVRITTNSALRGEKQLDTRDRWAWNNDCEEKRRQFFKSTAIMYVQGQEKFPWLPKDIAGYYRYDENGRPVSKICEEDGSPPKE